jgi:hypothetical protein
MMLAIWYWVQPGNAKTSWLIPQKELDEHRFDRLYRNAQVAFQRDLLYDYHLKILVPNTKRWLHQGLLSGVIITPEDVEACKNCPLPR